MILNCFNVIRVIKDFYGDFDDSVYILDYSTNQVKLSINSIFDWESLAERIQKEFPQVEFEFIVIAMDLIINW